MKYLARVAFLIVLAFPSVRSCSQTAYGPGGLFIHPTAEMRPQGSVGFNVSWFSQKIAGQSTNSWAPLSLAYGVSNRLEAGALFNVRGFEGRDRLSGGLFAKYQLLRGTSKRPAFAVTGSWLEGDVKLASLSGVASYTWRQGRRPVLHLHSGLMLAQRGDIAPNSTAFSLFAGVEVPISARFSLLAEYGTRFAFDQKERSSVGILYRGHSGYHLGVGWVNMGRSSENAFFIGVGIPLGGTKSQ